MTNKLVELLVTILPTLALGLLIGRMSLRGKLSDAKTAQQKSELERDELKATNRARDRVDRIRDVDIIMRVADTGNTRPPTTPVKSESND